MKLNFEKLEDYKSCFLRAYPDSKDFSHPEYHAIERGYKDELVDAFQSDVARYFPDLPGDRTELIKVADALIALFTRSLALNHNKPQNLVGWRYWTFARLLDDERKIEFARAVGALLDELKPLGTRVSTFQETLEVLATGVGEQAGPAMKRSVASFFLFLSDPAKYVYVKTREYKRTMKDLIGRSCFGQANEYEEVVEFTKQVKAALESDGWSPKDLIDVQSFFWEYQHKGTGASDDEELAVNDVEQYLEERFGFRREPTKYISAYETSTGRQLALERSRAQGQLWVDSYAADIDGVTLIREYPSNRSRNSNLKSQAPKLSVGRAAAVVRANSFASLEALCDWYEDGNVGADAISTGTSQNGEKQMPGAKNIILYGPPGTGKTYALKNQYFPKYTSAKSTIKPEEWADTVIGEMTWNEVVAAALHDLGNKPTKAGTLVDHKFILSKCRVQNKMSTPAPTIWGTLQLHTPLGCENVNVSRRNEPAWFWKDEESNWTLVPEWAEMGQHVIEAVERYKDGPGSAAHEVQRFEFVTFHQSYSYEEFVEGIRPTLGEDEIEDGQVGYELSRGIFRRICEKARRDPENRYALFIDEINRGNISKIFGELITLLEDDKREGAANELFATLPYSDDSFSVPSNLDVIGTMNTADRSLAHIDTALRRRFEFRELMPLSNTVPTIDMDGVSVELPKVLSVMNERIEALFDREHMIGHAYLINVDSSSLPRVFENRIIPLLTEYFFEDWSKVRAVLADDQADSEAEQFIIARDVDADLFGNSKIKSKKVYRLNKAALLNPRAYQKIYSSIEATAVD